MSVRRTIHRMRRGERRSIAEDLDRMRDGRVGLRLALVSDLGLPDGSGLDLMRGLRSHGQTVPLIAVSGYGQEQDAEQCRAAGFSAHVINPSTRTVFSLRSVS